MANADLNVTVSAEAAIHKVLIEFAQDFYLKFGVRIQSTQFEWGFTLDGQWCYKVIVVSEYGPITK